MFQIGETVVCGNNGVCLIEKIGPLANMGKASVKRDYYTLQPCFDNSGKIYLPVDTDKVVMRYVLSREEVTALVNEISDLEQIDITDEKSREIEYKNAVNSSDPRKLIRILKTMYNRRKLRIANGKKSTAIDDKYSRIAESRLYDELSLALGVDRDVIKDDIVKHFDI